MNDKEIFNHLLAMSLKISADRRLKAKKKKKLRMKEEIKFSVDRLLESYPIFECKMCHNRFNLKSDYYAHDCPNWEDFLRSQKEREEKVEKNFETEEEMPIFKIPKVPEKSQNIVKVPLTVENFTPKKFKETPKDIPIVKKLHKNSKAYKNSITNLQNPQSSTKLFELLTEGVTKRRRGPRAEKSPLKPQLSFSIDSILGLDRSKK